MNFSGPWQCERHIGVIWPHDNCPGPGMPLFRDLGDLQGQVQERIGRELNANIRKVSGEAELYADETDSCLAQAAKNNTTQRKEVKMDRWSDRHEGEPFNSDICEVKQDPFATPGHFNKSLCIRKEELLNLISATEDSLRAYRLEITMVEGALCAYDEFQSTPNMATGPARY